MNRLLPIMLLLAQAAPQSRPQNGVILGRIVAADGAPAADMRVAALPSDAPAPDGGAALPPAARTDSSGRYRLENLAPGRYYIAAKPAGVPAYVSPDPAFFKSAGVLYFPGAAARAGATAIAVAAGTTEVPDFRLAAAPSALRLKVAGRVTRADDQRNPVNQNQVRLTGVGNGSPAWVAAIDPEGAFEFSNVAPGFYLAVVGPQVTMPPTEVFVDDKDVTDLRLIVPKPGAIGGRILTRDGTPAVSVPVLAEPLPTGNTPEIGARATQTDSAGNFRVESVLPGRYRIRAGRALAVTYYPGAADPADAAVVSVKSGEQVASIDFRLIGTVAKAALKVSGIVIRDAALTPPPGPVRLVGVGGDPGGRGAVGARPNAAPAPEYSGRIAPDGAFEIANVSPGVYQATVVGAPAMQPVNVVVADKDIAGVQLLVLGAATLTGTVALEGPGMLPWFQLTFSGGGRSSAIAAQPTFTTQLPSGEYRISSVDLPSGFLIKSIVSGSTDLRSNALKIAAGDVPKITVTLGVSSPGPWVKVSGRVMVPASGPSRTISLTNAVVPPGPPVNPVLFNGGQVTTKIPVDTLSVPVKTDGAFEFPAVLPGTYMARVLPASADGPFPQTIVVGRANLANIQMVSATAKDIAGEFAPIPKGEFMMGCSAADTACADREKPSHPVRITKDFEMGKYEVTQAQWEAVMGANPSSLEGAFRPVESVSYTEIQDFLTKLNTRSDGYRYRLPTEAEWEYAARAGAAGPYAGTLDAIAWYEGNSGGQTHVVGQKQPNAWGLYDMQGNVWEWVHDAYDNWMYYANGPQTDPAGPMSEFKIMRGASALDDAWSTRVSIRFSFNMGQPGRNYKNSNIGFRLVREAIR